MGLDDIRMRIILGVAGFEAVNKAKQSLQGAADAANKAAGAVGKSGQSAQQSTGLFGRLGDKLKETEAMYDRVYRAGFQLQLVGGMLNDVGEKGLGILSGTVEKYASYDMMLRRAGVALNTNTEWQGKLDDAIKKTAVAVGLVKPEEAAEAYYMWGAATGVVVDNQKALNAITTTVNDVLVATAAAGGDLEQNLKGVYGIMQVYNRTADEGGYITHVLALMTERTAADFGDLTNAFSYIGPLAHSLGVTFEDTAQLLGILADAGQRGSRAGRGLSMILEGLSNPSAKAKDALDTVIEGAFGVGKSFSEIVFPKGEFIGMRGFIDAMAKSMDGLTDAERGYVYSAAFTNNATRALIPVVEKQIKLWDEQRAKGEALTSVMDQQKYALGGAAEFFDKMKDQMAGSINAIWGSFQNTFFPILQQVALTVMEVVKPALDFLKDKFDEVGKFMADNPGITKAVVTFGAIASIILVVLGTVLSLVGGLLVLGAGIGTIIGILPALAALALPVIAAIAAITAGVYFLYQAWTSNWMGIQDVARQVVGVVSDIIEQVVALIPSIVAGFNNVVAQAQVMAQTFISAITPTIQAVIYWFNQLWNTAVTVFNTLLPVVQNFVNIVVDFVVNHLVPAVQGIVAAFMQVWDFLQPILLMMADVIVNVIIEQIVPAFVSFATSVITTMGQILEIIGPTLDSVIELFTGLINFITKDLAPLWAWLLNNIFIPFFSFLVDLFANKLKGIMDIVSGAFEFIKGVIQVVLGIVKGIIDTFLAVIKGDWKAAGEALKSMANSIWEGIKSIINGALNVIKGIVQVLLSNIGGIFKTGLLKVKGLFTDIFNGIVNFLKGLFGKMVTIGKDLITGLWNGITGAIGWFFGKVREFIGNLVGGIFGKLPQSMQDVGRSVIEGLWNGIKSLAGWIWSKVHDLIVNIIPGPIRDALGIHSPSRITAEIGKYVALGLAQGIEDNTRPVLDSVDNLTGAVVARANKTGQQVGAALNDATLAGNYSFSSSNERVLKLQVEVVSPDGSVSRLTADQIAGLLQGSDIVSAVEHAASLD